MWLKIPRINDFLYLFPIPELRNIFGEKVVKSLFEQFFKKNPLGSVQVSFDFIFHSFIYRLNTCFGFRILAIIVLIII